MRNRRGFELPDQEQFPRGGEHTEYLIRPENDFELALEVSAARTVLHRQLVAVAKGGGVDVRELATEARPEGRGPAETQTQDEPPTKVRLGWGKGWGY